MRNTGSWPARRALAWAMDLIRARSGALHVVYADHPLIDSDLSAFAHAEMETDRDEKAARVDAILHAASVEDAAGAARAPITVTGRSHHPHRVLGSVPVELLHQSPYPVLTIT
jgi:nucleotide-binding universal stress UspA family protein